MSVGCFGCQFVCSRSSCQCLPVGVDDVQQYTLRIRLSLWKRTVDVHQGNHAVAIRAATSRASGLLGKVMLSDQQNHCENVAAATWSGWWFGCHFLFSHILGLIIPIDELIFFRVVQTTNQRWWTGWSTSSSPIPVPMFHGNPNPSPLVDVAGATASFENRIYPPERSGLFFLGCSMVFHSIEDLFKGDFIYIY